MYSPTKTWYNEMKDRAFLLEPTVVSVDKAERFGRVVTMFARMQDYPNPMSSDFQRVLLDRLAELKFEPERDHLVMSGRMTALLVMASTVAQEFGFVRLLLYEMRSRDYVSITIGSLTSTGVES